MQIVAQQPTISQEAFSGLANAIKKQGHHNYDIAVLSSELALQRDIQGNTSKQTAFKDFATNYTQMRVYLAMVGEQKNVTMIHTLVYLLLNSSGHKRLSGKSIGIRWRPAGYEGANTHLLAAVKGMAMVLRPG